MPSLYLHLPFCERKCFYCSFAVAISQEHRIDEYLSALDREASLYQGSAIETIYFGGGTPTLLTESQLKRLFEIVNRHFHLQSAGEITIEANPENMDLEKAKLLFDLGVTRVSLGVQTFNDFFLKYLGRAHDSIKALTAFNDLRRAGFENINVDLMYSFPDQTPQQIREDVQIVLGLGSEHVSLYTLTVEENSRFFVQKIKEQDNQAQGEQYDLVATLLNDAGMRQYEVSNFSRLDFESRHNINYWTGGNYFGLGLSSHSHQDGRRAWNVGRLPEYLKRMAANENPEEGNEILTPEKRLTETLVFGLRMNAGIDIAALQKRFSLALTDETKAKIDDLVKNDFLIFEDTQLKTTTRGRRVLDEISVTLI